MIVKEYIAFQTVDSEGDIWCNKAFLFESEEQAEVFFSNVENIMNTLELKLEEDEDGVMETIEEVQSSLEMFGVESNNSFYGCKFTCNAAGTILIEEMSKGFVISGVTV